MDNTLPERIDAAFDKLKNFPDAHENGRAYLKPGALAAFLELRQLWEREGRSALYEHRRCGEYVAIPPLDQSQS